MTSSIEAAGGDRNASRSRGLLVALVLLTATALATLVFGVPGLARSRLFPTRQATPELARLLSARMLLPLCTFALIAVVMRAAWNGRIAARRLAWLAPLLATLLALAFALADDAGAFGVARDVYVQGYSDDAHLFAGPLEVWREYSARANELSAHSRTHPPGPVLFFALTNGLAAGLVPACEMLGAGESFTSRDVLGFALEGNLAGFLLVFLQSLWLVPLFFLARRLYGERAAIGAVALGLVVPTTTLTAPEIDALFPLLAATAMWLLTVSLWAERPRVRLGAAWAAGLAAGLALAFSFGLGVVLAALVGIVAVHAWNERDARGGLADLAALGLGGLSAWALFHATGYDPIERLRGILDHHYGGVNRARPYALYLFASPYAFFLTLGPPIAWLCLAALRPTSPTRDAPSGRHFDPCAWSALAVIVVLTASGFTRGETERLWLPLVPLVVAPAGAVLARTRAASRDLLAVLALVFVTAALWSL